MSADFQLSCDDVERRQLLQSSTLNGIDYLELIPPDATADLPLIVVFCYHTLPSTLGPQNVQIAGGARMTNIGVEWAKLASTLTGSTLTAVQSELDGTDPTTVLVVRPTSDGDFSTYNLSLVSGPDSDQPPSGFDPLLSQVDFGFKVECPQNFDCQPANVCPPEPLEEPVIDYLTKDFDSFNTLMLNRLSLINPNWQERNPADVGVALVEILAYVGDQLSYYQDAVATEAYLGTARRRISIRRHARLLDYFMHDGCNARAWVTMEIDQSVNGLLVPQGTGLLTGGQGDSTVVTGGLEQALTGATVFETMTDVTLYRAQNVIQFYTWQETDCCLPLGGTTVTLRNDNNTLDVYVFTWGNVPGSDSATLANFLIKNYGAEWVTGQTFVDNSTTNTMTISDGVHLISITMSSDSSAASVQVDGESVDEFVITSVGGSLQVSAHTLRIGSVMIFEEVRSPTTGRQADADPTHRCAVSLTAISATTDPLDPSSTPLLDISWDPADAPSFPLCLEIVPDPDFGNAPEPVSVAHGNVVLADNGQTQALGSLPTGSQAYEDAQGNLYVGYSEFIGNTPRQPDPDDTEGGEGVGQGPSRFQPGLSYTPVTFAAPFDPTQPASTAFSYDVRTALPEITVLGQGEVWGPQRDLFSTDSFGTYFVAEVDNDGIAYLRFGDNSMGLAPALSTSTNPNPFFAVYRVGNGTTGNVGREAISRIVNSDVYGTCTQGAPFDGTGILLVRNPMEAQGGTDPEDVEDVRQFAPYTFNTQQRAVTPQDYQTILSQYPGVLQAFAQIEWTGSWWTVYVSVDRVGGVAVDDTFKQAIETYLNSYRHGRVRPRDNRPRLRPTRHRDGSVRRLWLLAGHGQAAAAGRVQRHHQP